MSRCTTCGKPLTIEIDPEEEEDDYDQAVTSSEHEIPDSVELNCGCHFHWECLLDAYEITQCPNCSKNILSYKSSGGEQILCNVNNEGGLQEGFDILPVLKEESYLKAFPEERKARAFLEFCAEGDVGAILDLVKSGDNEDSSKDGEGEGATKSIDVLRYQDPLRSLDSCLHVAIRNGQEDVAWLLLLLASSLEPHRFPSDVTQAAETLGAVRESQTGKVDIRVLENEEHLTAEGLARRLRGRWEGWVEGQILTPVFDGIVPVVF